MNKNDVFALCPIYSERNENRDKELKSEPAIRQAPK